MQGTKLLFYNSAADVLLLDLPSAIPDRYKPFYVGEHTHCCLLFGLVRYSPDPLPFIPHVVYLWEKRMVSAPFLA